MNTEEEFIDTRFNRTYLDGSNWPAAHFEGMLCVRTQKDKDDCLDIGFRIHSF
jgi:hypothetical protein